MQRILAALPISLAFLAMPALAAPTLLPVDRGELTRIDPSLALAEDARVRVHKIGHLEIIRVSPIIEGARAEGADRVIVRRDGQVLRQHGQAPLNKLTAFTVSEAWATVAATEAIRGSLIKDATVERISGLARRVWISTDEGLLAAWRVRVPTFRLRDLSDVWVDAASGEVLKHRAVARFQDAGVLDGGDDAGDPDPVIDAGPLPPAPDQAEVFRYAPVGSVDPTDRETVTLQNLRNANPGGFLRGDFIDTFNCCKAYVCLDGSSECELGERRCALPDDAEPIQSNIRIQIPTGGFNSPIPLPEVLFAQAVFCSELPVLRSEASGWFPSPVDTTPEQDALLGAASEVDTFAELQAYFSTMDFFAHIRATLDDSGYCLSDFDDNFGTACSNDPDNPVECPNALACVDDVCGATAMGCNADGTPFLGAGGEPQRPFHIAVNTLLPEIDIQDLTAQLFAGRGADEGNPILVETYQRLDNAAFIPALESGPVQVPDEFRDLLTQFNRPFDSNVYFQGVRDFAYDGDIVFHEFMHAVTYGFVPDLGSFNKGEFGVNAEAGALNEGWSDYFAASFLNDPDIAEYGAEGLPGSSEIALRSTDNNKNCPLDINGQVHDDSQPWSGALWQIREDTVASGDIPVFDRALLSALAESEANETFAAQAERVLAAMDDFGVGDSAAARTIFEQRGAIGCDFAYPLHVLENGEAVSLPKTRLFLNTPGQSDLAAFAPAALQFRVEVPPGTSTFTIRWSQASNDPTNLIGGQPERPLILIAEQDTPIRWRYDGAGNRFATAVDADGADIAFDPANTNNQVVPGEPDQAGLANATFTKDLGVDACNARVFHLQVLSVEQPTVLQNISIEFGVDTGEPCNDNNGDGGPGEDPPEECGCSSSGDGDASEPTTAALALIGLGLVFFGRRRRD